jgi:hypothetical protein
LVARADRQEAAKRALLPMLEEQSPLFLFAPRYPLGTERGITPEELRGHLGAVCENMAD